MWMFQYCHTAIGLDGSYAKAYGRLGLALTCQNQFGPAVEAYKNAIQLDPSNRQYTDELAQASQKHDQSSQQNTTYVNGVQQDLPPVRFPSYFIYISSLSFRNSLKL